MTQTTTAVAQIVSTLAGSGTAAFANGTGTAASFDTPTGVAVDINGNIYVADMTNHRIRKITVAGVVTTLAGSGAAGSTNGTGVSAKFSSPRGVAVDANGNVYVADASNNLIRKITSAGVVTTLAGSTNGFVNATGVSAKFSSPRGVAVDDSGNVYVADRSNNAIRKITSAGVVTTLAGQTRAGYFDGTGTVAKFNKPSGVAVDASGNVYVADQSNNRIRKITSAGVVTTLAGQTTAGYFDGTGTAAKFNAPTGVSISSLGNLFVADQGNNRIREIFLSTLMVTSLVGDGTAGYLDGTGTTTKLNAPYGLAMHPTNGGLLYIADQSNNRIRKVDGGATLPVELTSFTAHLRNGNVILNWTTATESANYGFEIERSSTSLSTTEKFWDKISFVKGNGTSASPKNYTFTDVSVRKGAYTYRLKQIDRDGTFEYHKEASVVIGLEPNKIVLDGNYPNPFNPATKIRFVLGVTDRATLKVYDILGKEIVTLADKVFNANEPQEITFNASGLPSGTYYYMLRSDNKTEIRKMILMN